MQLITFTKIHVHLLYRRITCLQATFKNNCFRNINIKMFMGFLRCSKQGSKMLNRKYKKNLKNKSRTHTSVCSWGQQYFRYLFALPVLQCRTFWWMHSSILNRVGGVNVSVLASSGVDSVRQKNIKLVFVDSPLTTKSGTPRIKVTRIFNNTVIFHPES